MAESRDGKALFVNIQGSKQRVAQVFFEWQASIFVTLILTAAANSRRRVLPEHRVAATHAQPKLSAKAVIAVNRLRRAQAARITQQHVTTTGAGHIRCVVLKHDAEPAPPESPRKLELNVMGGAFDREGSAGLGGGVAQPASKADMTIIQRRATVRCFKTFDRRASTHWR